jgi:hypothetical protein
MYPRFLSTVLILVLLGLPCMDVCHGLPLARAAAPPDGSPDKHVPEKVDAGGIASKCKLSWDGPEIRRLQEEWSKMKAPPDYPPPSACGFRNMQFISLLEKRVPKENIPDLIKSMTTIPIEPGARTETQKMLVNALESLLIDRADRENLVELFAIQFTDHIFALTAETALVVSPSKLRDKDPILVLGDAYARSQNATIRTRIAVAVRRSFDGLGVKGKDDQEYVRNAMQWYRDNKHRLVVNVWHDAREEIQDWAESPLFIVSPKKPEKQSKAGGSSTKR